MVTAPDIVHASNHATLLVQDRSGKTDCFNCIIDTHQTRAFNLARRMLDDWSLAEDAVQESLVSAYRAYPQFMGDNLSAWLMCIVANTCRDMLRSRRARPTVPLNSTPVDEEKHSNTLPVLDLPSTRESPEEQAERGALNRAI